MPSPAELLDIYEAYASWENAETLLTTAYPSFQSFATFPTRAEAAAGIAYPYAIHGCDSSVFAPAGIDPSLDTQTHIMWTAIAYASNKDDLDLVVDRDAVWRNLYRRAWLKHLRLTDKNVDLSGAVLRAEPTGWDLFGRIEVALKFSWPISTRVILTTGL